MADLSRRRFLAASAATAILGPRALERKTMAASDDGTAETCVPKPKPHQAAWQDLELGFIYHFDMPVYLPGDWAWEPAFRQTLDPNLYNPTRLDTDQWLAAAKAAGARYAVFTATHMGGFLQWQSDLYPYGVKQTKWRDGKGDVVGDFVESCRRVGIKPGLYVSIRFNAYWTMSNTKVNFGKGGDEEKQKRYVAAAEKMVEEICSRYGDIVELWFDGGVLAPEDGGPDVLPIAERLQPDVIFYSSDQRIDKRWAGNENGTVNYPCWATMPADRDTWRDRPDYSSFLGTGDPEGKLWCPAMADAPLRGDGKHEWFWRPGDDDAVYSLDALIERYEKSVGRNANLVLGMTPNRDGLIPDLDMKRCEEMGKEIRRRYGKPLAEAAGEGDMIELALPTPGRIDSVILMEDIVQGERIREFTVEARTAPDEWREITRGECIGHKRIQTFPETTVSALRLRVTEATEPPRIRRFAAFHVGADAKRGEA